MGNFDTFVTKPPKFSSLAQNASSFKPSKMIFDVLSALGFLHKKLENVFFNEISHATVTFHVCEPHCAINANYFCASQDFSAGKIIC
jgi:hypothetical protein